MHADLTVQTFYHLENATDYRLLLTTFQYWDTRGDSKTNDSVVISALRVIVFLSKEVALHIFSPLYLPIITVVYTQQYN